MPKPPPQTDEHRRLSQEAAREQNWKRWGPYLSERQWGTVREDYSPDGNAWDYFPHEHARSRAYRWGEDGLLGFTDRECRLCFALALWNGRDTILKERLFGLTGPQGNHGEDVKETYFYLDATPTYSYARALYKYPQAVFPYDELVERNARRGRSEPEYELEHTGVFDEQRYFDVTAEYAKAGPDDILIRITVANRGPDAATLHLLPTLWFRNTWVWGCKHEGCTVKPHMAMAGKRTVQCDHETLGRFRWEVGPGPDGVSPPLLFTDNHTNQRALFDAPNDTPYVKDAFHRYVVQGETEAVNPGQQGTKAAAHYVLELAPGETHTVTMRLFAEAAAPEQPLGPGFARVFESRLREADAYFETLIDKALSAEKRQVMRQGYAGLLWSKQFYNYVVADWLQGDPGMPLPPEQRKDGRNSDWRHLFNRDVISMPDKWEYPWYAAWDLAFHMIPFARLDPAFAKKQLTTFLREWYLHPNGQLPAYEWALSDVNPPVHAWACWRVYKMTGPPGQRDTRFLASAFQKLILNFTWWVNRKDTHGRHLFSGGFLGLDNIGVFDRSRPLPTGGQLQQADGTAWMAFFCGTMLSIALELAQSDPVYEDMASKFFEHFVYIADAINTLGQDGLWDNDDGFYYDQLYTNGHVQTLPIRSLVGLIPLIAVEVIDQNAIDKLPGFKKRMQWFLDNLPHLSRLITYMACDDVKDRSQAHYLLALPSRERLERILRYMLDEQEFLSPFGVRSMSSFHAKHPYALHLDGQSYEVSYAPGESEGDLFGGNSNWRGPVWFPINYLLIEALERYHHFYRDSFQIECPTGSGQMMNLGEVAAHLSGRLTALFAVDDSGERPALAGDPRFVNDPHFADLLLFHEYFHAETGVGLGASHQTGWTALACSLMQKYG